jgi:hypothetical protein
VVHGEVNRIEQHLRQKDPGDWSSQERDAWFLVRVVRAQQTQLNRIRASAENPITID